MPKFRRREPPRFIGAKPAAEPLRGSRHERGYGHEWAKFAAAHLKANPLCAECLNQGRDRLADLVDHKHPVRDGGAWFDRGNVWSLCRVHHDTWKRKFEAWARAHSLIERMRAWCDNPETRPRRFRCFAV